MLQKPFQRKLILYLSAMALLNIYLFWKARHDIEIGLPDFTSSYTAAIILREGERKNLYDLRLQEAVQRAIIPTSVEKRGAALPYNHPPFEALIFWPLSYFSYAVAYWIWFAFNLILLGSVVVVLRSNLPALAAMPFRLWALACLSSAPIFVSLLQGQDSILLLCCLCMAIVAIRKKSDYVAGVWLGFGLFKFHILLPFVLPFLFLKRKALLAAFATVALFLTLVGSGVAGLKSTLQYPSFLWALNHNLQISPLVTSGGTPTLYGLIAAMGLNTSLSGALMMVASFGLVVISTKIWQRAGMADMLQKDLSVAANVVVALLLSYHLWAHDMSLLILPTLFLAEVTASERHIRGWARRLAWICIVILNSTPVTFFLLAYHKLFVMSVVMLVLIATLSWEIFCDSAQMELCVPLESRSLNLDPDVRKRITVE